jgi:hypothetical protein
MADYTAIAAVSSSMRRLLRDRMEEPGPTVTLAPPDVAPAGVAGKRLNLYLYQVNQNGFLANQEIPGQGHPSQYGHPPLSLDLQYLVTGYPAAEGTPDAELESQGLLGDAMRVMHDYAIITPELHEDDDPLKPTILDPALIGEFERIKISLLSATVDDFSKIWSALPETNFRRSVAYHVSVVQILSQRPRRQSLPVRRRLVKVLTLKSPRIDDVFRQPPLEHFPAAVAEIGETIRIVGANFLSAAISRVVVGDVSIAASPTSNEQIDVVVPASLAAQLQPVQVVSDIALGDPEVTHPGGFASNVAALLVIPRIVGAAPASAGPGATVTVTVDPPIRPGQNVQLLLDDRSLPAIVPSPPPSPGDPPSPTAQFLLPAAPALPIAPGSRLMRVRVDGAESRLHVNPATGAYDGPTYTVL